MGFFDKFQQPKSEIDALDEKWAKRLFPGGRREVLFRANVAVRLSNGKLTEADAVRLCGMLKTRFHLASDPFDGRTNLGPNAAELVEHAKTDSKYILNTTEAAAIVFYLIFDQVDNGVETYALLQNRLESLYGSDSVGCDQDEIPGALGEFGLEPTNPIPVRGLASNEVYLDCLRTSDGHKVDYKRKRSVSVPNVYGPVDEYEISQAGGILCSLYLAPHNGRISQRPPRGFSLLWTSDPAVAIGKSPKIQQTTPVDELPSWADWATKLFTAASEKRNIEFLRTSQMLINQRQEQVGGLAVLRKGTGPAKVVLNYTDLASWGFVFFHIFLDDLANSPREIDRAVAGEMLATADRDPAFHNWIEKIVNKAQQASKIDVKLTPGDFLNAPYPLFMSPEITGRKTGAQEEYIAYRTGEFWAKSIGEKVTGFVANSKELMSGVKLRSGKATVEDASRILHNRFFKDPDFYYTHCKSAGR